MLIEVHLLSYEQLKFALNEEKHALSNANLNITFNEYINILYIINSSKKIELYIIKSETLSKHKFILRRRYQKMMKTSQSKISLNLQNYHTSELFKSAGGFRSTLRLCFLDLLVPGAPLSRVKSLLLLSELSVLLCCSDFGGEPVT